MVFICPIFPGILWNFSFSAVTRRNVCLSARDKALINRSFRGLNFQLIVCVQCSDLAPPSVLKIPQRFNQVFHELIK